MSEELQKLVQPLSEKDREEEKPAKRRGGRKPMTPEEKLASAKLREEQKRMAENLKPLIYVQYQETEAEISALIDAAKAEFRKEKKRTPIKSMKLYVKPDERTAYYVINEKAEGKISY